MAAIDFNQLHAMYAKRLFYIAFQYTKDKFLAEDIVQESFLKAYKKLDTVEDMGKLGGWLSAITARTAIDFLRSEKRRNWMLVEPSTLEPILGSQRCGTGTEEAVDILLLQENLIRSLENLSKEFQVVLILKVKYGLKETEIASVLDLKSATVKTRLYRARKQLKQAFDAKESA